MGWTCSLHCVDEKRIQNSGQNSEKKKRSLGRPRPRLEDNIKIDVKETRFEGVD
jgi:hypothetical protein